MSDDRREGFFERSGRHYELCHMAGDALPYKVRFYRGDAWRPFETAEARDKHIDEWFAKNVPYDKPTPAPEPPARRCDGCKWWYDTDGQRGRCGWLGHNSVDPAYLATYRGGDATVYGEWQYLWTTAAWFCAGWEARKESDDNEA